MTETKTLDYTAPSGVKKYTSLQKNKSIFETELGNKCLVHTMRKNFSGEGLYNEYFYVPFSFELVSRKKTGFCEHLLGLQCCKAYIDLEKDGDDSISDDELKTFLLFMQQLLTRHTSINECVVLNASRPGKQSYHFIFNVIVPTQNHMGDILRYCTKRIGETITIVDKQLVVPELMKYVDLSVYGRSQSFRMINSLKWDGEENTLLQIKQLKINKYKFTIGRITKENYHMALISYVDQNPDEFTHLDDLNLWSQQSQRIIDAINNVEFMADTPISYMYEVYTFSSQSKRETDTENISTIEQSILKSTFLNLQKIKEWNITESMIFREIDNTEYVPYCRASMRFGLQGVICPFGKREHTNTNNSPFIISVFGKNMTFKCSCTKHDKLTVQVEEFEKEEEKSSLEEEKKSSKKHRGPNNLLKKMTVDYLPILLRNLPEEYSDLSQEILYLDLGQYKAPGMIDQFYNKFLYTHSEKESRIYVPFAEPFSCPLCTTHEMKSMDLIISQDQTSKLETICIRCSEGKESKKINLEETLWQEYSETEITSYRYSRKQAIIEYGTNYTEIEDFSSIKFKEKLERASMYCLQSPMGCGKTQLLLDYLQSLNGGWIYVSFRISLLDDIHKHLDERKICHKMYNTTWDGVSCYCKFDCQKNGRNNRNIPLLCQFESISKDRHTKYHEHNVLVLDETVSLIQHLPCALQEKNKEGNIYRLTTLVQTCNKIIGLDAAWNVECLQQIMKWKQATVPSLTPKIIKFDNFEGKTNVMNIKNIFYYPLLNDIYDHMQKNKNPIVICTNSKTLASVLFHNTFSHIDKKMMVTGDQYASYGKDENGNAIPNVITKLDILKDVDKYLEENQIQVFIYTGTISAGVSIMSDQYKDVYGFFLPNLTSSENCFQMLGRVRKSQNIHISIYQNTTTFKNLDLVNQNKMVMDIEQYSRQFSLGDDLTNIVKHSRFNINQLLSFFPTYYKIKQTQSIIDTKKIAKKNKDIAKDIKSQYLTLKKRDESLVKKIVKTYFEFLEIENEKQDCLASRRQGYDVPIEQQIEVTKIFNKQITMQHIQSLRIISFFLTKQTGFKSDTNRPTDLNMKLLSDAYISDLLEVWKYYKLLISKKYLSTFSTLGFVSYEDVEMIRKTIMQISTGPEQFFYNTEECKQIPFVRGRSSQIKILKNYLSKFNMDIENIYKEDKKTILYHKVINKQTHEHIKTCNTNLFKYFLFGFSSSWDTKLSREDHFNKLFNMRFATPTGSLQDHYYLTTFKSE